MYAQTGLSFVVSREHPKAMLERADAALNASPPALAARNNAPLVSRSLLGQAAAPRQDYALDSHFLSESFIGRAPKTRSAVARYGA